MVKGRRSRVDLGTAQSCSAFATVCDRTSTRIDPDAFNEAAEDCVGDRHVARAAGGV